MIMHKYTWIQIIRRGLTVSDRSICVKTSRVIPCHKTWLHRSDRTRRDYTYSVLLFYCRVLYYDIVRYTAVLAMELQYMGFNNELRMSGTFAIHYFKLFSDFKVKTKSWKQELIDVIFETVWTRHDKVSYCSVISKFWMQSLIVLVRWKARLFYSRCCRLRHIDFSGVRNCCLPLVWQTNALFTRSINESMDEYNFNNCFCFTSKT